MASSEREPYHHSYFALKHRQRQGFAAQIAIGTFDRSALAQLEGVLFAAVTIADSTLVVALACNLHRTKGPCFSSTTFFSSFQEAPERGLDIGYSNTFANLHHPTNYISCTRHILSPY